MDEQLQLIAKSYDRHIIEYGKKDTLAYDNLPEYITQDPDYIKWRRELESGSMQSGTAESGKEIRKFLAPDKDMKFIHLGCNLNLMLKEYDEWPSTYYGVDISSKTIELLNDFVARKNLLIGSLYCGSVHETPFDDSYFDIGDCIGVLEYYEKDFVEKIMMEAHRIMKPDGKFVLDIPNIKSPSGRIMMLIEECMGRPDKFDMLPQEFEEVLEKYFVIEEKDEANDERMGMGYFLRCKK